MSTVEVVVQDQPRPHLGWETAPQAAAPACPPTAPFFKRLEGKVAIITGAAHGIGEATAHLFARHGAKVVVADIDEVAGELVAASLPASAVFVHCDVSREPDVERLLGFTLAQHGRVDIYVSNAGVLGTQAHGRRSVAEIDPEEFERVMRVNVMGPALGIKHAARAMVPRRTGCIVSMASVAGVLGGLGPHAYTASKHAVVGLTKSAACELGRYGIRVNCISPFGVATGMLVNAWRDGDEDDMAEDGSDMGWRSYREPTEREVEKTEEMIRGMANLKGATLRARDIADAALYLVSDDSRYISGHNLVVDGGVTTSRNLVGI